MNELSLSPMRASRPVLFYDELSPMSRSCLMLIELARLDVEIRFVDLSRGENFREEFIMLNPALTVPILVHDNQVIVGSAILIYLCDCTCSKVAKEIYPSDSCTRIQILNRLFFESSMLARRHSDIMTELMSKAYLESDVQRDSKKIYHMYDVLETYLCGSNYMVGDSVTIADIAIMSTVLGLDLIFPIVGMECYWPKLSKWFMNVSRLRGYSHIQKGIDRQRWVVETAGQFHFSSIKISPDILRGQENSMRCQKEATQYSGNSKRSSLTENITEEQFLQNGVILIPPMTDELVSPNSTLVDQQGQFFCCQYNYPCPSEREQQQSCIIKSIIATGDKPKTCNCVRISEDIGCDTGSPLTMSARDQNESSKNFCDGCMRKDRRMNSRKDSKNLSEVSVVPVTEIPCYSTCEACDCSYKPLPTDRPLIPLDKNRMEENCQRQNRENNTCTGDSSYPKQTQACEGAFRTCACKTESAFCPVIAPCERSAQPPACKRKESLTKSISSEFFQRVQKQTAYNTDQNCMTPRTNLLNKNSDSTFSFNTNLFQNNMCRQDPPYQKQVPTSSDIMFNNFNMYERQSFSCPMRSYSRADDSRFLSYSVPPMSYSNDPEFDVIRRSGNQSPSMYAMAGSVYYGRTSPSPRQYAHGYPQMTMNENTPLNNMCPHGYGNHSDCCPIHSRANRELNEPFNNQDGSLNMMTGSEPCASQDHNSLRTNYPTDYNNINNSNRRESPSSRKKCIKPTPPPPPPPPSPSSTNGCGCNKWNENVSANSQATADDLPKPDEQALANYSKDPKITTEIDDTSNQNHRASIESGSKQPEIRISVLVHERSLSKEHSEQGKRSSISGGQFEQGKRSSILGGQSEQGKRSSILGEQSEQEKLSPVPEEQSEQEKLSPISGEQSEQEKLSPVPEEQSEQEKLSPVSEEQSEQEKRSSISGEQSEQEKRTSISGETEHSRRESIGLYIPGHKMSCSRRNTEELHRMKRNSLDTTRHNPSPADNHPQ